MFLCSVHWSLIASTTFILVALVLKQTGETTARHTSSSVNKAKRCRNKTNVKAISKVVGVVAKPKALFSIGTKQIFPESNKPPTRNCPLQKRQAIVGSPKVPLNQTIPYWFAAAFNASDKVMIRGYLGELQNETCLRFEESESPLAFGILFANGTDCSATPIYKANATNTIHQNSVCLVQRRFVHEIMHMLGFLHEHQRPDAKLYVTYNSSNIQPNIMSQYKENRKLDKLNTPYDMGSIMHYGPTSGQTKNASGPTITTINKNFQKTIGQRMKLSFLDAFKINKIHCETVCSVATTKCKNGGYPDVNNCQICKCPSGFGGDLCEELGKSDDGCGGTLIAESHTKLITLIDPVSNKNFLYSECNWLIKCKDPGNVLHITFLKSDPPCADSNGICQTAYFELKVLTDQRATGTRICCGKFNQSETIQTHAQSLLLFRNHKGKSNLREFRIQITQIIPPKR